MIISFFFFYLEITHLYIFFHLSLFYKDLGLYDCDSNNQNGFDHIQIMVIRMFIMLLTWILFHILWFLVICILLLKKGKKNLYLKYMIYYKFESIKYFFKKIMKSLFGRIFNQPYINLKFLF